MTQFIVDSHEQKIMCEYTIYEVAVKMQGNKAEVAMAESLRHNPYANPKRIGDFAPYFRHIQAKFYEMTEDGRDPSLDYEAVIPELVKAGWQGELGQAILGGASLETLAQRVQAQDLSPQPRSGRQERLENLVNRFV